MIKRFICYAMVFSLLTLGVGPVLAEPAPEGFSDLQRHWAQADISAVYELGLMNGMGENEQGEQVFSPDGLLSRAQLAVLMQRIFELDYGERNFVKQPQASDYYLDVNNSDWYAEAVKFCAINEIFDSTDNFSPEQPVTRIETARAIHRCVMAKGLNIPMILLMPYYHDMEGLSAEDNTALVFASNTSLMKGDREYWRPQEQITRAEMATVLNNLLRLLAVKEGYNDQEYSLNPGQSFAIMLDSNPTTGYTWTASYDEALLSLLAKHYRQEGEGKLIGQGGQDIWRFKALKAGTAEIKMVYSRSWENVTPLRTFTCRIIINPVQADTGKPKISSLVLKEKSDTIDIDIQMPVLSGISDTAVQSIINKHLKDDAMEFKLTMEKGLKDYLAECIAGDYPIRPYQLFTRYHLSSLTDSFLSLYVDYYQYTGGAHGITERRAYNVDLSNGEILPLSALFEANYDYKILIESEIRRQIALDPENYFEGDMGFKGISESQNYYLEDGNLVIYFPHYEIAPYVAGIPKFKIPLKSFEQGSIIR